MMRITRSPRGAGYGIPHRFSLFPSHSYDYDPRLSPTYLQSRHIGVSKLHCEVAQYGVGAASARSILGKVACHRLSITVVPGPLFSRSNMICSLNRLIMA
ncbi:Piso0_000455 [Millerozyma farinosa CBS 7064]|uniref:Piso0_000455 protein n=1 Tax=Pichia sorbitophila (strain ATCC MYA-4447 / BCRC 22081 / CBS 7064 / NBRC 10061 / NRRL Y-12695) TaxID=559304 RepID=G8YVH3_PICSO|nr:Piso0_000455 [Millerozyma farinosa CBS 7064]CCE73417.1 Piso0_000455 [Millerozyma farinosa CBS 7064]